MVSSDVLEELERLKRKSESYVLCYEGSQLVTALQERNLVDEYALFIHPAALGPGVPFFVGPSASSFSMSVSLSKERWDCATQALPPLQCRDSHVVAITECLLHCGLTTAYSGRRFRRR